jgi:hypothetical protein
MTNEEKATIIVDWALTHWVALLIGVATVVVAAFLAAALTEWRKRHISKKTEEKVEGWVIQKTLALSSTLFAGLGLALPFLHTYLPVLSSLKYVGGFVVSVYAAGNFLYALKFKKWFKGVTAYLEARRDRLAAKKAASDVQPELPQSPELQPTVVPDSPFEA